MKTKYFAYYGAHFSVEKIEIIKESENFVYTLNWAGRERMHAKKTKHDAYFDTELEAWQWLYDKACEENSRAQQQAEQTFTILNKITEQIKSLEP
jgi:hypothetical protein